MVEAPLVVSAIGVRWRLDLTALRAHDPQAADLLHHLWTPARVIGLTPREVEQTPTFAIVATTAEVPLGPGEWAPRGVSIPSDIRRLPYDLSRALTLASIAERAGEALMLHAAGLVDLESGLAVALVAPSGTGKTTAARTLGRSFGYVSDETVCLEPDGTLSPYPKPLSVVVDPDNPYDKDESSPDDLELLAAPDRAHLGALVLLERDPSVTAPTLEPAELVEALAKVTPQTSSLLLLEQPLTRLAEACSRGGGPYRLTYAEIETTVPLIQDLLARIDGHGPGGPVEESPPWRSIRPEPTPEQPTPEPGMLVRAPFVEAISTETGLFVQQESTPMSVSGLGALLWLLCETPHSPDELVALAQEEIGEHPDAERLVRSALDILLTQRVLLQT